MALMYPIHIFGMFQTSIQVFAITLPIYHIFCFNPRKCLKIFIFTLKNIEKLPKFYPIKRQHYTPPSKKGKTKVPVHVYGRVHNAQCFFRYQIYLLIHARILRTKKRYKRYKEIPMGHHMDYLYPKKWLRSFPDISRVCSPDLVP